MVSSPTQVSQQRQRAGSSIRQTPNTTDAGLQKVPYGVAGIAGMELINALRKGQARWIAKGDVVDQTRLIHQVFGLTVGRRPPSQFSRPILKVATELCIILRSLVIIFGNCMKAKTKRTDNLQYGR